MLGVLVAVGDLSLVDCQHFEVQGTARTDKRDMAAGHTDIEV
jgi:hypothetical protein